MIYKEVAPRIFAGDAEAYEQIFKGAEDAVIVQAAKMPYHRDAVGYTGNAAPKDSPEYLTAIRADRIILNMFDGDDPKFFSAKMITPAIRFAYAHYKHGKKKVLFHCNKGFSRGPSLAMLFMSALGLESRDSYVDAKIAMLELYPEFAPNSGIEGQLLDFLDFYMQ